MALATHGAQHPTQERLELAIRRVELGNVDGFAGRQIFEDSRLKAAHLVAVVDLITLELALG